MVNGAVLIHQLTKHCVPLAFKLQLHKFVYILSLQRCQLSCQSNTGPHNQRRICDVISKDKTLTDLFAFDRDDPSIRLTRY